MEAQTVQVAEFLQFESSMASMSDQGHFIVDGGISTINFLYTYMSLSNPKNSQTLGMLNRHIFCN